MKNVKINKSHLTEIQESDFRNKLSYRRFLKGLKRAIEMQELKDAGYILFIDGAPMNKEENFVFGDMNDKPCFGVGDDRCMYVWLGSVFCAETGNVHVDKEEMEIFNTVSYIDPKHIRKMRKL